MPTGDQGGRDPQRISSAKFWLKSALVIVVVGILLAWVWMPSRPDEPAHQGKTLSEWITVYRESASDSEEENQAKAAIQNIGTNGIPTLLKMLQTPDSTFRTTLKDLLKAQTLIESSFRDAWDIRSMATSGFHALGEDAKGAVPALITLVKRGSGTIGREEAIDALGHIGPSAQAAVPMLLAIASDAKDPERNDAIHSLGMIHSAAESVVPFLTSCLRDSEKFVRLYAVEALKEFGEAAKSSVPSMIPLLSDPDRHVRQQAINALKRIDPAAAAAAGVK